MRSAPLPPNFRPVRMALLGTLILWAVSLVSIFFLDQVEPVRCLLFGLAYSILLTLFGVGLALAQWHYPRCMAWWPVATVVPLLGMVAVWLSLQLLGPKDLFAWIGVILRVSLGLILSYLAAGCVLAGMGWVAYLRHRRAGGADPGG